MTHISLKITLQDPVVLSEREATSGSHRTLRHVPGSVLLGVAASRLYRRLSTEEAFLAFHSGRVRFGAGLPSTDGRSPAWPTPICLHRDKLGKDADVHNACFGLPADGPQRVALRDGFLAISGEDEAALLKPSTLHVTKTAIDGSTGSAADSQLFSYECLASGQVFIAGLDADEDVPPAFVDAVVNALVGEVRLGRSRSAEFGRAIVERVEHGRLEPSASPRDEGPIWLLSDLAALDAMGQPTVQPRAADLGLPGHIDWTRSFVRTRRYSPWNAFRGGYDAERLLLQAGSVLWITGAQGQLREGRRSLGRHTEAGLGHVWIAPPLLMKDRLRVVDDKDRKSDKAPEDRGSTAPTVPSTPLLSWFRSRAARLGGGVEQDRRVDALVSAIAALYARVSEELAPPEGIPVGPSSSQWRDVARLAETPMAAQVMKENEPPPRPAEVLFGARSKLDERPGWSDPYWDGAAGRRRRFNEGVAALMTDEALGPDAAATIALVARRLSKHPVVGVRNENRGSSPSAPQEARR
jgi:CRISPR-associated protein Csx10